MSVALLIMVVVSIPLFHVLTFVVYQRTEGYARMEADSQAEMAYTLVSRDLRNAVAYGKDGPGIQWVDSHGNIISYTLNARKQLVRTVNQKGFVLVADRVQNCRFWFVPDRRMVQFQLSVRKGNTLRSIEGIVTQRLGVPIFDSSP
jgi:type II secretory pathway component PulJ